jgi:paraquat-inducible protein B
MAEAHATIDRKKGINPIWFVPVVALVIGIGMVIYTLQSQGPEIRITLSTAEGIEQGKTKIKLRDVDIGMVESVVLGDDRESVIVTCSVEKSAADLLRKDTQFWVVRPRIGAGGVSGLGTLLSGGYIQLAPGMGDPGRRDFVGLEEPPVTPTGTPGVKVVLTAEKAGAVSAGDPVLFRGYRIGRVETETFDVVKQVMTYDVFINAPYDELLTTTHRFWDVSGISVEAGADGIKADSVSLETLLVGGVEVGLPEGIPPGAPAVSGEVYKLYDDFSSVNQRPYRYALDYVVRFPQSVRGLSPGAPVEYRGLRLGEVRRVMLSEMTQGLSGKGEPIPVLIRIEPGRFELPDNADGAETLKEAIASAVKNGLRATLSTGNLLTGSLYVAMDYFPNSEEDALGIYAGRTTIPTITSGIDGISQKLTMFLDKLNELPLEDTMAEAQNTLASLDRLVASDGVQALPVALDETLTELQSMLQSMSGDSELQSRLLPTITELERTLASLRQVLDTLDEQPNALIFNRKYREDLRPPTGSQ